MLPPPRRGPGRRDRNFSCTASVRVHLGGSGCDLVFRLLSRKWVLAGFVPAAWRDFLSAQRLALNARRSEPTGKRSKDQFIIALRPFQLKTQPFVVHPFCTQPFRLYRHILRKPVIK